MQDSEVTPCKVGGMERGKSSRAGRSYVITKSLLPWGEGARGTESVVRSARWCNEMRPHSKKRIQG